MSEATGTHTIQLCIQRDWTRSSVFPKQKEMGLQHTKQEMNWHWAHFYLLFHLR